MRFLQLNLNHCEAAQDLLTQTVRDMKIDVAIISEPYRRFDIGARWVTDSPAKAGIWACGNHALFDSIENVSGFVRAKTAGIYVYSCYAPPPYSLVEFEYLLTELVRDARDHKPAIIAGDFNAWAEEWGSRSTNRRGEMLLEALAELDMVLCNEGNTPTWSRGPLSSFIDVTFASRSLMGDGFSWKVCDLYTNSDHSAILLETSHPGQRSIRSPGEPITGWKTSELNHEVFEIMLEGVTATGDAEDKAVQIMEAVTSACDASMPRRSTRTRRPPAYWWTQEIAGLRKACLQTRRRYQRAREPVLITTLRRDFADLRRQLKRAIKTSKRSCWRELCREVENDVWGRPYKVVMNKFPARTTAPSCPVAMREIVSTLFPQQPPLTASLLDSEPDTERIPPVTWEEMMKACSRLGNKKAPGPDNIPNAALKAAIRTLPGQFIDLYNSCLKEGKFPDGWKRQRLVLIPKKGPTTDDASSYRPICMLDSAGKVLERIICDRLEGAIADSGGLARHQYGFRKAHSTIDAIQLVVDIASKAIEGKRWKGGSKKYCGIITLDVKNAFNTTRWDRTMEALERRGIPEYIRRIVQSYFHNRRLLYPTEEGVKEHQVTGGVPQGSVLGPTLWNVMYDGILRLQIPDGATIVGFADDIAIVVVAKEVRQVELTSNAAIHIVQDWLSTAGLVLAEHKTEAVLVSSRKIRESMTVTVGTHNITSQKAIRYLGVIIDDRLSFGEHITQTSAKAARTCAALSRIMPNTGGASLPRRKLLTGVLSSMLLYAAPVWAEAMRFQCNRRRMGAVYRRGALRMACAYRTVSDDAAGVVAGALPIDLLAVERRKLWRERSNQSADAGETTRRRLRDEANVEWQRRWTGSLKGRWTHRLIPELTPWISREAGEPNFYLSQLLTGHGCFRAYLYKKNLDTSPNCPACDVEEDVDHVFFVCPRFGRERAEAQESLGHPLTPESLVPAMLRGQREWAAASKLAKDVLLVLRELDTRRREM